MVWNALDVLVHTQVTNERPYFSGEKHTLRASTLLFDKIQIEFCLHTVRAENRTKKEYSEKLTRSRDMVLDPKSKCNWLMRGHFKISADAKTAAQDR